MTGGTRLRRVGVVLVGLAAAAPVALVGPAVPPAVAAPAPATVAPTASPDLPVSATLVRMEPRDAGPGSLISVQVQLKNTGDQPTGPLAVRLQRGSVLQTRAALDETDGTGLDTAGVDCRTGEKSVLGLAPNQARNVQYSCTAARLGLEGTAGVYPLGFLVRQDVDGGETVGKVATLLPYFPTAPTGKTRVALLWPLLDRPHRLLAGDPAKPVFTDDALGASVRRNGALERLLSTAERLGRSRVLLTLVLDPETIEALREMAAGEYQVAVRDDAAVPGKYSAEAAAWLQRLRALAPRHQVVVTPYADPDVVALDRQKLTDLGRHRAGDAQLVSSALGVRVDTDVAWPPGDQVTPTALDSMVSDGARTVVLDPSGVPTAETPDATPNAASRLRTLSGDQVTALVTDAKLQELVTTKVTLADARQAEQRYVAELAMITAESPGETRTVVVAPPRRWQPAPPFASALGSDLDGRIAWLTSARVADAAAERPTVTRSLGEYEGIRAELPQRQISNIARIQGLVGDLRSSLSNTDASKHLAGFGDALRRAGSSAWRDRFNSGLDYDRRLQGLIDSLRIKVSIAQPASGHYTLASSNSPLSLTLVNELPVPVKIKVRFTVTTAGFSIDDVPVTEIPANAKATLRVAAEVQRTGTFVVLASVSTVAGGRLGPDNADGGQVRLTVRSTAYGKLALGITGLAFAVLVGAVIVRAVRRMRAGPAGPSGPTGLVAPPASPADRSLL